MAILEKLISWIGFGVFVNGSSYNYDNKTYAGFSVIQLKEVETSVMCIPCKQPCSVQLVELKVLTDACWMLLFLLIACCVVSAVHGT